MPRNVFFVWLDFILLRIYIRQWNSRCVLAKGPFIYYVYRQVLRHFLTHHPLFNLSNILIVSKKIYFLNPPTQSSVYVIYEWSLRSHNLCPPIELPLQKKEGKKAKIEKACFLVSFSGLNWLKHTVFVYWKLFCFLLYVEYKSVREAGL